ncbi:hypothetical protein [Rubripirellula reticaptiva]|nr:hypothetical protein [Rubripirellula reticaptiva]
MPTLSDSSAELSLAAVPAPRLSIRHLMLWTFCCAVYWALIREVNARSSTQLHVGLFGSIMTGADCTGVITLISMRVRGRPPLLKHPGHWLLSIGVISTLTVTSVMHTISSSIALMNPLDTDSWEFVVLRVVLLIPSVTLAFACTRIRDRSWKLLFMAMVLVEVPGFLYFFGIDLPTSYYRPWLKLVLAFAMVGLSIVEIKNGPRRDWLHWTGITAYLVSCRYFILPLLAPSIQ